MQTSTEPRARRARSCKVACVRNRYPEFLTASAIPWILVKIRGMNLMRFFAPAEFEGKFVFYADMTRGAGDFR